MQSSELNLINYTGKLYQPAELKIFKAHGAQKAAHTPRIRVFRAPRTQKIISLDGFTKSYFSK